jgi:hypothetical protein
MFGLHVLAFFFSAESCFKKCGRDINCSLDYSPSWVKNSIVKSKQSSTLADFFHQSAPVKIGLSTCKQWSEHAGGWIFFFAELCVPNIFERENPIVDFSIQWYHADLTGLYIYVKCKMNFKEHTYQRNWLYIWRNFSSHRRDCFLRQGQ